MQGKEHYQVKCQQAQNIQGLGWKAFLPKYPLVDNIQGYSSVRKIAGELGVSEHRARHLLIELREKKKIKALQARDHNGKLIWMYKD